MAKGLQIEQFLAGWTDNSGQPLAGGKVYTYAAGTNTALPLYTDKDCTIPANAGGAASPVTLDSNGRLQVYADSSLSYKFIVKTSADATLYTLDNLFYPRETFLNSTVNGLELFNDTSDGSDSKRLLANGGGTTGVGRGAEIQLHGNESAGSAGRVLLQTGNASGAPLDVVNNSSNGDIRFWLNAAVKWLFQGTTFHLLPNATDTFDIGSAAARVRNLFAQTLNSSGTRGVVYASTADVTTLTLGTSAYAPTYSAAPTMSLSGTSTESATVQALGQLRYFYNQFVFTIGGTPNQIIYSTLPATALSTANGAFFANIWNVSDSLYSPAVVFMNAVGQVNIIKTDSAFVLAKTYRVGLGGIYAVV